MNRGEDDYRLQSFHNTNTGAAFNGAGDLKRTTP